MNPTIDVESTQAVAVRDTAPMPVQNNLFGAEPTAVVAKATAVADALKAVIVKQGLVSNISGKEYPKCEAWTLLGTMLGIFPVLSWTRPVDGGWEARVEAKTLTGVIVGAAEAQCLRKERNWSSRDDFALRSMAQTRATAKCLRMPLGFVMSLAGFEATPAEEMVADHPAKPVQQPPPRPAPPSKPKETDEEKLFRWKKLCIEAGGGKASYADEVLREVGHLLPTETLEDLHTTNLPKTKSAADEILAAIKARSGVGTPPSNGPDFSEPFWGMICPIPSKGMKRDEYLKSPDTIRSLYEASHDDETARNRLFGMVEKFTVSDTWVNAEGKTVSRSPASVESDKRWREALDQFKDWHDDQNQDVVP